MNGRVCRHIREQDRRDAPHAGHTEFKTICKKAKRLHKEALSSFSGR
jgi:hypothetical protein